MIRRLTFVLALCTVACYDNNCTQEQTVNPTPLPSGTPAPTPSATPWVALACNAVTSVKVNAPASMRPGETAVIDATPRDAQGSKRDPRCDEDAGISWNQSGPCSVSPQIASFNPTLTATQPATGAGICQVTATVSGVEGSAVVSIS
jgi:hypothetical protein